MSLTIGETVGAHLVIEQPGQGRMATVFKACHAALDRYVAPNLPGTMLIWGDLYLQAGRNADAVRHYARVQALSPGGAQNQSSAAREARCSIENNPHAADQCEA